MAKDLLCDVQQHLCLIQKASVDLARPYGGERPLIYLLLFLFVIQKSSNSIARPMMGKDL